MDFLNNIHKKNSLSIRLYLISKNSFDILLSMLGIILLSPVLLLIGLLILLDDPNGNVIYSQERVGKDGRLFKMYKFRSMVSNADDILEQLLDKNEIDGPMFKMKDDPRVTKIGKFIRKYSLDELPQLFNVLIGDMALVGPRPPLQREVDEYEEWHMQRLTVKPGCTGLWQATARNSASFDDMVRLDIKYIENASLGYDILIIMKTIWIMIKPNSAY